MAGIIQVIKYEGDNSTFIWKHPDEDFNIGSQLIVHESQEAVFFLDGQALDLFGSGRYTLHTKNIPLLGNVVNIAAGGQSPFHCEVYFINKTEQMGIKWGTDSKVNYLDPNYNNYPFPVGASGQMSLRVKDSRKLLIKLAGTVHELSQSTLVSYFQAPMMMKIKAYLPEVLRKRAIPIFDVDRYMAEFSAELHNMLSQDFADYGVEICQFWINAIVKPENDPFYCKLRELRGGQISAIEEAKLQQQVDVIHQETEAQKMSIQAQAFAQKRQIEGYTYQQEKAYDVAERLAENDGIGNFSNAGIGLALMGGMAGGLGAAVAELTSSALEPIMHQGTETDDSHKATPQAAPSDESVLAEYTSDTLADFELRLKKLELLKGKIPDALYEAKLKEILDSI